jgi:hypothetical protein
LIFERKITDVHVHCQNITVALHLSRWYKDRDIVWDHPGRSIGIMLMPLIDAHVCARTGTLFETAGTTPSWVCPRSKEVFGSREEYRKHLKSMARINRHDRDVAAVREKFAAKIKTIYKCVSPDEICRWLETHGHEIAQGIVYENSLKRGEQPPVEFQLRDVKMTLKFSDHLSNSHSAPEGKEQNWRRDPNLPLGYPGWAGVISGRYDYRDTVSYTDVFKATKIRTESGSGNGRIFHYNVKLFAEEWPSMLMYQKLKGTLT